MENRLFILAHDQSRRGAHVALDEAPAGYVVRISKPARSRDQNDKLHAMFSDVAKCCEFMGQKRDTETWKRLLVDSFARIKQAEGQPLTGQGEIVPNLDGTGFVQLGVQTRRLKKAECAELIEFLYAWGAEKNVRWSEPAQRNAA
jgi:hypothetical protein